MSSKRQTNSAGLRRDIELLQVLGKHEVEHRSGLGVIRIAELAGREKTQVSRALATLAEQGLVDRDPRTLLYRLGWRLYSLSAQTYEAHLVSIATPYLRRLAELVQETAHLCVLRQDEVLTLSTASPAHGFRAVWEGLTSPAPSTSAGRVLLCEWEESAVRTKWTDQELANAGGARHFTSTDEFVDELAKIKKQGYCIVDEEFEIGVVGCSAPIRDAGGRIVAALNIGAPKARLGARLDQAAQITRKIAREMSASLYAPHSNSR
jgi:DNA-binding IclR family transcriptional regulator